MEKIVLEKSTNTHSTTSNVKVIKELNSMTTIVLDTKDDMVIEHGHHRVVATEPTTNRVIKITQQEYNPLLKAFQNAFD